MGLKVYREVRPMKTFWSTSGPHNEVLHEGPIPSWCAGRPIKGPGQARGYHYPTLNIHMACLGRAKALWRPTLFRTLPQSSRPGLCRGPWPRPKNKKTKFFSTLPSSIRVNRTLTVFYSSLRPTMLATRNMLEVLFFLLIQLAIGRLENIYHIKTI